MEKKKCFDIIFIFLRPFIGFGLEDVNMVGAIGRGLVSYLKFRDLDLVFIFSFFFVVHSLNVFRPDSIIFLKSYNYGVEIQRKIMLVLHNVISCTNLKASKKNDEEKIGRRLPLGVFFSSSVKTFNWSWNRRLGGSQNGAVPSALRAVPQ